MPKIKPIEMETRNAKRIELTVTMVDHPASHAMTLDITKPRRTPRRPPVKEISVASITNWRTMSRRLAPMARRTPISRVRSEEHTSELQSLTNLVCRLLLEKKKKENEI